MITVSQYLSYFKDKRLINVFAFGIASGFPWVLFGSVMSAWLKDEGLSRSLIGLFGIVTACYSFNWLWSPLVDRLKLPLLHNLLGQRRSWILLSQLLILMSTFALSQIDIKTQLYSVALCCFIIALAGATQDISIDAFRIDVLSEDENHKTTAAATMATSGWWAGYALLGALPFYMADLPNWHWQDIYFVLAIVMLVLICAVFFAREPQSNRESIHSQLESQFTGATASGRNSLTSWLWVTLVEPFKAFFRHNGVKTALALLAFIFLFKIGEAFLGRMSIVFYKEVGFSNSQIATYSKIGTGLLTIVFAFIGSLFNTRYGIVKGLFISGIAMAASNLMFSLIALVGPDEALYAMAIFVDGFTQAWSLVAMVAFISMLCDRAFSATHYALLASLGNLGRALLSSYSGILVDWLDGDWAVFFLLTSLMVIPSLIFLYFIRNRLMAIEAKFK